MEGGCSSRQITADSSRQITADSSHQITADQVKALRTAPGFQCTVGVGVQCKSNSSDFINGSDAASQPAAEACLSAHPAVAVAARSAPLGGVERGTATVTVLLSNKKACGGHLYSC